MPSCAGAVGVRSIGHAQNTALYPQSTDRYYNTRKLMRRVAIHKHSPARVFTQAPDLFSSVKYSYTHYPQALWIQINYRKLLV